MFRRIFTILGGFVVAALACTALLYAVGALLRPDVKTPARPPDPARLASVLAARKSVQHVDLAHPPVVTRTVNYAEGNKAGWWPKAEAPVLADLVREGKLPPVAERTGPEPVVMRGADGIGRYGGTWYRFANSHDDVNTIRWRLSDANLVRWSPLGYPLVPHLAKSWEASPDFREYIFTLRKGVRWSDGYPLTTEDIVYWYENEVKYFQIQPRLLRAGDTTGTVEKLDDLRVKFTFAEPNPLFPERLASTGQNYDDFSEHIVPAHYLRQFHPALGDQKLIARLMAAYQLSNPVALYKRMKHYLNPEHPRLWPWVYRTYSGNSPQTFVRNPYYFAVDQRGNQLPYLDRLVLDEKNNNLIAVAAANGEPSMQERHIRYEDHILLLGSAERNGYEVYHWKPATQSVFALFPNLNRRIDPDHPETAGKRALLNAAAFRQALSLALNRRDIIAAEFNGQTEPAQIAPGIDSPNHNERLLHAFTDYDPARANQLLDDLGLTQRDTEGYRTLADGRRLTFVINITDFTVIGPAQFVVDDWARVGVRAVVRERGRKLWEQEKLAYEHDFTVWTGESEFYPLIEPRNFVPTYWESFYAPAFGVWFQNGGLHGDPAAGIPSAAEPPRDHPLRRAMEIYERAGTLPTEAERRAAFNEVLEIAADNLWSISIATPPPQLVIVKNGFRGVPRVALFGAGFISPANTGIETYFWDHVNDAPGVFDQTKAAIAHVTPPPAGAPASSTFVSVLRWLAGFSLAIGAVWLGWRHPFLGRRMLWMVPTLLAVSAIVFTLVQLPPGDYITMRVAQLELHGSVSNEQLAADLRRTFHLDESPVKRYARWLGLVWFTSFSPADTGLLQGNLGLSMELEKPVNEVIGDRLVLTLIVTLATVLFTWLLAVPAGIYSALRQHGPGDYGLAFIGFIGLSVPSFLLALVILFAARRWFDVSIDGLFSSEFATAQDWSWAKVVDLAQHLWLPVVVLGFGGVAGMMRVMRANLLDELQKPYVTTARAKGLRPLALLLRYPVRLALNPFVSGLGSLFPQLVSGGAIVAMVLSLPLLGPTLLDALLVEDVYLASSLLMLLSLLGMIGSLVSDLLLLWLDPRIRTANTAR